MYQTAVYIVVSSSKLLLFQSPRTALIYSLKKLCFSYFALVHPLSEKKAALALSPLPTCQTDLLPPADKRFEQLMGGASVLAA